MGYGKWGEGWWFLFFLFAGVGRRREGVFGARMGWDVENGMGGGIGWDRGGEGRGRDKIRGNGNGYGKGCEDRIGGWDRGMGWEVIIWRKQSRTRTKVIRV
jgi:hypothetical protein